MSRRLIVEINVKYLKHAITETLCPAFKYVFKYGQLVNFKAKISFTQVTFFVLAKTRFFQFYIYKIRFFLMLKEH